MIEYAIGELIADGRFDVVTERARTSYGRKLDVFTDALLSGPAGKYVHVDKSDGGFFGEPLSIGVLLGCIFVVPCCVYTRRIALSSCVFRGSF